MSSVFIDHLCYALSALADLICWPDWGFFALSEDFALFRSPHVEVEPQKYSRCFFSTDSKKESSGSEGGKASKKGKSSGSQVRGSKSQK